MRPIDLEPEIVARNLGIYSRYDQPSMTWNTASGADLPGFTDVAVLDTTGLASSLQAQLPSILTQQAEERVQAGTHYFHVEAGITMADLQQLLDHQSPRLAIQASGGSPGATLAGTLSTATHGGEFAWPLLVDRVRAIHLVDAIGHQWWIEGAESIADQPALERIYPALDSDHFLAGPWEGLDAITPEDVLKAVTVSMGSMGVIYSVVLEVVPQFGLQQIVTATDWPSVLRRAGTSAQSLRENDVQANRSIVDFLTDGLINGTGISAPDNVYVDLAINPVNLDCWITNRRVTPGLPKDSNSPAPSIADYLSSVPDALKAHAVDSVMGNYTAGRIFDFLSWATNIVDAPNDIGQAGRLVQFVTAFPDPLIAMLGLVNAQAVANVANAGDHADRGNSSSAIS